MAESEARKKYRREWAAAHKERGTAAKRRWVGMNRIKARETARIYRQKHRDKFNAKHALYRTANPDKIKNNNLRRLGWTLQQFNEALETQKFCCAICGCDLRILPSKQVHSDHCHLTGFRRGVLCHHCNTGLGGFRDTPEFLKAAIAYLTMKRR